MYGISTFLWSLTYHCFDLSWLVLMRPHSWEVSFPTVQLLHRPHCSVQLCDCSSSLSYETLQNKLSCYVCCLLLVFHTSHLKLIRYFICCRNYVGILDWICIPTFATVLPVSIMDTDSLLQWYSTIFVHVPPKVVGAQFKLYTVYNIHLK